MKRMTSVNIHPNAWKVLYKENIKALERYRSYLFIVDDY